MLIFPLSQVGKEIFLKFQKLIQSDIQLEPSGGNFFSHHEIYISLISKCECSIIHPNSEPKIHFCFSLCLLGIHILFISSSIPHHSSPGMKTWEADFCGLQSSSSTQPLIYSCVCGMEAFWWIQRKKEGGVPVLHSPLWGSGLWCVSSSQTTGFRWFFLYTCTFSHIATIIPRAPCSAPLW